MENETNETEVNSVQMPECCGRHTTLNFCSKCGNQLKCCGRILPENSQYCPDCGKPVRMKARQSWKVSPANGAKYAYYDGKTFRFDGEVFETDRTPRIMFQFSPLGSAKYSTIQGKIATINNSNNMQQSEKMERIRCVYIDTIVSASMTWDLVGADGLEIAVDKVKMENVDYYILERMTEAIMAAPELPDELIKN